MAKKDPHKAVVDAQRMQHCLNTFKRLNIEHTKVDETLIEIMHNGNRVFFYPYTGWHTGKGIIDGRGLRNLLKQL